jgi:hypothetical protein
MRDERCCSSAYLESWIENGFSCTFQVKLRISYRHSADTDRHKQTDTRRSHASGSDAHEMRQIIADIHESMNGLTNKHSCSVIKRHQAPFFFG